MTVIDEVTETAPEPVHGMEPAAAPGGDENWDLDAEIPTDDASGDASEIDERPGLDVLGRPLLATALAAVGAGLVVGGTFGSWSARILCVLAALIGTAWAYHGARATNALVNQLTVIPLLLAFGTLAMVTTSGGSPDNIAGLIGDAVDSGRLFRPPVPYDPGWRIILAVLFGIIAYGAGSLATQGRPKAGVGVVVPFTLIGLFSQPDDATFLASVFAFLPILGALAVLFGDDGERASELGQEFELRRAVQGGVGALAVVGLLLGLNSASFLFPDPIYDPDDQPQKPRAVPLSASDDRVLFTVETDSTLTGPWRVGALDVYDDDAFQSVPSESRLTDFPADGTFGTLRTGRTQETVTIGVTDLGDTSILPTLAGTTRIDFPTGAPDLKFDPRYQTVRVPTGRVEAGLQYIVSLPPYATETELEDAAPVNASAFENELVVPDAPPAVEELLRQAPANPWLRLDFLRQTMLDRVVAAGAGTPVDMTSERVQEILQVPVPAVDEDGNVTDDEPEGNDASPFEIVATEALLARWAGIPSRIGFGFDGLNLEDGTLTVRPRNSAQWLEVFFDGYGWIPLIGQPSQAKASIDNDPNARSTPTVEASADIAVQVYVIYEQQDLRLLYERLRNVLFQVGPWIILFLVAYGISPGVAKIARRRRRRAWGESRGPLAQIVVEYAEFRDMAIDLSVGDDYDTPLEYLSRTVPDREHEELAWLLARSIYGDLDDVGPDDVAFARTVSASLRSRLLRAQPVQSRALALISRASIEVPWNTEMPNVRVIRLGPYVRQAWDKVARPARAIGQLVSRSAARAVAVPRGALDRFLVRREQAATGTSPGAPS